MNITDEINNFYYHMAMYELQVMNDGDYYDGLSYNSILYINIISQMEDCTVSKMAEMLHVTKSAVTLKINDLVKQGVVLKAQSDDDRRVYYLKLSPEMTKTVSVYDDVFNKIEEKLKKKYTAEQLDLFADVLHSISGYEWRRVKNE